MRRAPANDAGPPGPDAVKRERHRRFMEAQQAISLRVQRAKVGRRLPVIVDAVGPAGATGRSKADAPEIDGSVHVASRRPVRVGDIVTVRIERADAYDLHGVAV